MVSLPPATFAEALQLYWFAWVLRRRGTIGRLDQALFPFYRDDLAAGRLTRADAFALLRDFWDGCNRAGSGDTLVNVMLGGQDRDGHDATTDLSCLMLEVALAVRQPEPHVNVRLHAGTPPGFVDLAVQVQLLGHGQATVYHDEGIIPELVRLGVPLASARNYANDGCTEVTIDGESGITFYQVEALKSLELTLFNGDENVRPGPAVGRYVYRCTEPRPLRTGAKLGFRSGDFAAMRTYDELYAAFLAQYQHQVEHAAGALRYWHGQQQEHGVTAPFLAGTFPATLATGVDPLRGGFAVPCWTIFAGSLTAVADALAALRQVVFDDRACTPAELLAALRADFVGHEPLRQRCLAAPKFGNDDDYVDTIAADLARRFCDHVTSLPTPTGKPYWPALFDYLFNDHAKIVGATPDGRRWQDPVAEHFSPTPGHARRGPTAVINSATKAPLARACGSAIFHVSLARGLVPATPAGHALLKQLLQTALAKGAGVVNFAIYDVAALRAAQQHPEQHRDLVVRVWGYSARFVDLSSDMQDHIIARAIAGDA